jgi:ubiquinone/menaquinone biosynthesis C-methylase UbiE
MPPVHACPNLIIVPDDLKSKIKDSYDAIADTYAAKYTNAEDPARLGYIRQLIEKLQASGKNEVNVLELGCGAGIPATKFMLQNAEPTFRVTGNDLSTAQLERASSNLAGFEDRLTLKHGDMLSLSFSDSTFDAVTGFYSIVHLPREEQSQLMQKITKWLKPGGFFLANFSTEDLPAAEVNNWMDHAKGYMFWSGWGEKGSLEMVEGVGLEVLLKETHQAVGDTNFIWILAEKSL